MYLYEIIHTKIIDGNSSNPKFESSVVNSVFDEELAGLMLDTYREHQSEDESYQIRTIRIPPQVLKW